MSTNRRRILILYTGGTIGMILKSDGAYHPFSFENLQSFIPELRYFPAQLEADAPRLLGARSREQRGASRAARKVAFAFWGSHCIRSEKATE